MKIVYIAEEEELKALIRGCTREEIESILQGMTQKETVPERLNLQEASEYLGVSKSYIYKLTHTRMIPFNKFGRREYSIPRNWMSGYCKMQSGLKQKKK